MGRCVLRGRQCTQVLLQRHQGLHPRPQPRRGTGQAREWGAGGGRRHGGRPRHRALPPHRCRQLVERWGLAQLLPNFLPDRLRGRCRGSGRPCSVTRGARRRAGRAVEGRGAGGVTWSRGEATRRVPGMREGGTWIQGRTPGIPSISDLDPINGLDPGSSRGALLVWGGGAGVRGRREECRGEWGSRQNSQGGRPLGGNPSGATKKKLGGSWTAEGAGVRLGLRI